MDGISGKQWVRDLIRFYTRLTLKSYEGKSAQIFGNSTKNSGDTVYWRKDLDKSYLFPKFAVGKASLDSIGTDSVNGVFIDLFVGNRKNPRLFTKCRILGRMVFSCNTGMGPATLLA